MVRMSCMLALALLAGCGAKHPADRVTTVEDDDPQMNAAIDKARSSVNSFIQALKSPKPGQAGFSVKKPFQDDHGGEHIWLTPVQYDGQNFQGMVNNEPVTVKNVKFGDRVSVAPTEISDWMYIDNGRLVGGETLRVLRNTLSPQERAEFDQSMPFKMD